MAFKDDTPRLEIVDLGLIDPDPLHVRKAISDEGLKGLTNAVRQLGLIQPIIVRPAGGQRYQVIVGERRRLAALQAGETAVPVIVRTCSDEEALEIRVFENIGLGVRSALEPREMANAVQAIAARFPLRKKPPNISAARRPGSPRPPLPPSSRKKSAPCSIPARFRAPAPLSNWKNWPGKTRPRPSH